MNSLRFMRGSTPENFTVFCNTCGLRQKEGINLVQEECPCGSRCFKYDDGGIGWFGRKFENA